jgi:hypothetical protein
MGNKKDTLRLFGRFTSLVIRSPAQKCTECSSLPVCMLAAGYGVCVSVCKGPKTHASRNELLHVMKARAMIKGGRGASCLLRDTAD